MTLSDDSIRVPRNSWVSALAAIALIAPLTVQAESGYYVTPSVSAFAVYDDNIFYTFNNQESATIVRLTPSLELGYQKDNVIWSVIYRIDAEDYTNNSAIESGITRRFADAAVEYLPNSRLSFSADMGYTKTDTPADLSLVPGGAAQGLLIGRTNAQRFTVTPSMSYKVSPTIKGELSYTYTEDSISGVLDTDIRRAALDVEHTLSQKTTLMYGHFYREVQYDEVVVPASAPNSQSSDSSGTTWLGLSTRLNAKTNTNFRAGIRSADSNTDPYWLFSIDREYRAGEMSLSFERNETTAPGTTGSQEFETLVASISYQNGLDWLLKVTPSYAKVTQREGEQKVYRLSVEATYRLSNSWFVTASYERNYQPVDFAEITDETIDRNVGLVGITYTMPN